MKVPQLLSIWIWDPVAGKLGGKTASQDWSGLLINSWCFWLVIQSNPFRDMKQCAADYHFGTLYETIAPFRVFSNQEAQHRVINFTDIQTYSNHHLIICRENMGIFLVLVLVDFNTKPTNQHIVGLIHTFLAKGVACESGSYWIDLECSLQVLVFGWGTNIASA